MTVLSVAVLCTTDVMTSIFWLKSKSHPHSVARVRGKFVKLGSGAMGSKFREQLTHWTDPAVFTQPDQWKGFLSAMVTAHKADILHMRNFLEEITKNKCNQGGLTLKDLKPDTFESNEKSKLSFRQWSVEFSSWVERMEHDEHLGADERSHCDDLRQSGGFTQTVTSTGFQRPS